MLEQPQPHVRNQRRRELGVPSLVPDRDDRGDDSRHRQHRQNLDQRLEILLAERIVDQEFQAQRHDDIEQRLDHHAEADECQYFLVVLQERFDECIDRRQRAGGFLGGKDDEIFVVFVISSSSSSSGSSSSSSSSSSSALRGDGAAVLSPTTRPVAPAPTAASRHVCRTSFSSSSGATGSSAAAGF